MTARPGRLAALVAGGVLFMAADAPVQAGGIGVSELLEGGTPAISTTTLEVVARGGERNDLNVVVTPDPGQRRAAVTVTDTVPFTNVPFFCSFPIPGDRRRVACDVSYRASNPSQPTVDLLKVLVAGSDGDDRIAVAGAGASRTGFRTELIGGQGDDLVGGGPQRDVLNERRAGDGSDRLIGGGGVDLADYSLRRTPLTLDLAGDADDGARGERDSLARDIENVRGGNGDDSLTGNRRPNALVGFAGRDRISGLGGADQLDGGSGRDRIAGGKGRDRINCGPGLDVVLRSFDDLVRRCEKRR